MIVAWSWIDFMQMRQSASSGREGEPVVYVSSFHGSSLVGLLEAAIVTGEIGWCMLVDRNLYSVSSACLLLFSSIGLTNVALGGDLVFGERSVHT